MRYQQAWAIGYNETHQEIIPYEILSERGMHEITVSGIQSPIVKDDLELCLRSVLYFAFLRGQHIDSFRCHVNFPIRNLSIVGSSYRLSFVNALFHIFDLSDKFLPQDTVLTGDICIDGTVLAVDGIDKKYIAFKKSGLEKFLIPAKSATIDDPRVIQIGIIGELV
jgi:ATP-dependent Lon protease